MEKQPCVFSLASGHYGRLYVGVTSALIARLYQQRTCSIPGFTRRYGVHHLVRYDLFGDMEGATLREKQVKRRHRQGKISLIESDNHQWSGLGLELRLPPSTRNQG